MTNSETKVSNSYLSSNPDFNVADDRIANKAYQQVKLIDPTEGSTDPIGVPANPMEVSGEVDASGKFLQNNFTLDTVGQTASPTATAEDGFSTAILWMNFTGGIFEDNTVVFEFSPDGGANYFPAIITGRAPGDLIAGVQELSQVPFIPPVLTTYIGAVNLAIYPLFRVRLTVSGGASVQGYFRAQSQVNFDALPRPDTADLATETTLSAILNRIPGTSTSTVSATGLHRIGAEYNASVTNDATNGAVNTLRLSQARALHVEVRSGTSAASLATETTLAALNTKAAIPATPTRSSVAASASTVTILSANASRKQAEVYNDSSVSMYLARGSAASTTSFTAKLLPGGYYSAEYAGELTAVWDSATGSARVTETV